MPSITYTVTPSFATQKSLRIQIDSAAKTARYFPKQGGYKLYNPEAQTQDRSSDYLEGLPMDYNEAEALWQTLQTCQLQPAPEFTMGLDGETYELELSSGWNVVKLKWWSSLPPQWQALQPLLDKLERLLERHAS